MPLPALPVVLVGGLHAEARRAAVRTLLAAVPGGLALHHDLSHAHRSLVTRVVSDAGGPLGSGQVPLPNDCACCALRDDLVPALVRLAEAGTCRLAVVELWDSVEPQAMAEVLAEHGAGRLRLTGVVTAVDPALVRASLASGEELAAVGLATGEDDARTVAETWARQVEYAPLLALGAPSRRVTEADRALLRQLHPTARWVDVRDPAFPPAAVRGSARPDGSGGVDVAALAARQHPGSALLPQLADEHGVRTMVWRQRRPFHPERLYAALPRLTALAPRSRGRFWLADRPDTLLGWDAAGGSLVVDNVGPWLAALARRDWDQLPPEWRFAASLDWDGEVGDRGQHLVFTGPGLKADKIRWLLGSCLLNDAEYAAGRSAWLRLGSAFDELLDPVS
ncbi:cobalamin biosynthesis protein CobW [Streptomyces sp. 3MP-14]|uniref:Cobalamin biosynthesis protein CobW n=1 Tax=Streptomyces mimosae TaxID=2586635 RepID=A0A5N6A756_9ACTN|nr:MULTISPECIES: GTP-binding protein [Streptomyces]KAB8163823.1 cobalamin biosynthesis protein CobW [Streptomyces mimosae]KAB8175266.1 cobalamin biosynthesis protein CobW [Streptomyces sp. 3MP-14]